MTSRRFNILNDENSKNTSHEGVNQNLSKKQTRRQESQASFDRMWHLNPQQFDPTRNSMEKERLDRTLDLILRHLHLEGKSAVDLGCGSGIFSRKLTAHKALVDAVDISGVALKYLQKEDIDRINAIQDFVPSTMLPDDHYDLVVSMELIAYLPEELYRLYFSELARLVKPEGYIVCSTSVDVFADEALSRFLALAETELHILECKYSYHRFAISLLDFFKAPARFIKAAQDREYRLMELENSTGFSRWWFSINSSPFGKLPWYPIRFLFYPFVHLLGQHRKTMLALEKICHFLCGDSGISHVVLLGKRKPIINPLPHTVPPKEIKHKKQLWE